MMESAMHEEMDGGGDRASVCVTFLRCHSKCISCGFRPIEWSILSSASCVIVKSRVFFCAVHSFLVQKIGRWLPVTDQFENTAPEGGGGWL